MTPNIDGAITDRELAHIRHSIAELRDDFRQHVADDKEALERIGQKLDEFQKLLYDRLEAIHRMYAQRLPVWATIVISILTAAIGVLSGMLAR